MVYMKTIPPLASCGGSIHYQFPDRDEERSTSEVDAFRFPFSPRTFWITFRITCFTPSGDIRTDPVSVRLVVRTAEGTELDLISWRKYPANGGWWSCRWPLPSFSFQTSSAGAGAGGIWIDVQRTDARSTLRVELQGFEGLYEESAHYILIDEEDRHRILFQSQGVVRTQAQPQAVATIHDLLDEELPATHGVSPLEIDGVALFPLGARLGRVDH